MTVPESQKIPAGQYYLLEKIAQGGMAEIYKGLAYDLAGIKKTVCIKKILPHISASREFIDMLVGEAKLAVKLNHGNIAQIYDLGKVGDDYFMVMEYVEGQNLSRLFKRCLREGRQVPISFVLYIISEVAQGLNYMHLKSDEEGNALHIIHRDMSPQNVMVTYAGTVKIIDFGIAKAAQQVGHTDSGTLKGKFAYMSPEQARGDKIDHRSDIFSLGVILYELLTGKRLFKGTDNRETLRNVRRARVVPPSETRAEISGELEKIVTAALSKDKRRRYSFAHELTDDLTKFLYHHYPEFKAENLGAWLQNLFAEELKTARNLSEADLATPHLILDKTHSALVAKEEGEVTAGGPPIDWREFLLEPDWPEEELAQEALPQEASPHEATPSEVSPQEAEEFTYRKHLMKLWGLHHYLERHWVPSLAVILFATALGGWAILRFSGEEKIQVKTQASSQPVTAPTLHETQEVGPAKIIVESNPKGAKIYLDDLDTGKSAPATLELESGANHSLGLYLANHRYFTTLFEATAGLTQRFFVEMALDFGSLEIVSSPTGAKVVVNGRQKGTTPLEVGELKPGEIAKVEVVLEGFEPWQQEILVLPGRRHFLNPTLSRANQESESGRATPAEKEKLPPKIMAPIMKEGE